MTFQDLSKEQLHKISVKGGLANRTAAGHHAWANAELIRKEHGAPEYISIKNLSRKYKVGTSTIVRILRG